MKNVKKYLAMFLVVILSLGGLNAYLVEAQTNLSIVLNGKAVKFEVDNSPFIDENGRTQVPVRFIAEQMGAEVLWEESGKANTVTVKKGNDTIELVIGEKSALVNGEIRQFDTSCFIKNSKTFVPLSFISGVLGATVDWNSNTNTVTISTKEYLATSNAPISTTKLSYIIPDTGQTATYGNTSEIVSPDMSTAFYGQDGSYTINKMQYTKNNDGTVTDNVTGLMWQSQHNSKISWETAKSNAEQLDFAGYDDWRLPTIKELYSLIDYNGYIGKTEAEYKAFIDTNYFTFTFGSGVGDERIIDCQYWSATKYVSTTMNNASTIFGVNFADGRIKGYPEKNPKTGDDHTMYSLYVRGNTEYGVNKFVDNGDATITDTATGLMWSESDSMVGMDWEDALKYAEDSTLSGYSDWRLPTAKELQSIVDYTRSPETTGTAAIDPIFNITKIKDSNNNENYPYFWTGTTLLEKNTPTASQGQFAKEAIYVTFGKAQGYMAIKQSSTKSLIDIHGAGAVRSDPKSGDASKYSGGRGPQGDEVLINNFVRLVRTTSNNEILTSSNETSTATTSSNQTSADTSRSFTFAIQADSHLGETGNIETYKNTLKSINSNEPSFLVDLGDTFMSATLAKTQAEVEERYVEAEQYFNMLDETPIHLVTGNRDGENGFNTQMLEWVRTARLKYFPIDTSLSNLSGNTKTANYYSFVENNAQFIILDPFTFTTERNNTDDGWVNSLGKTQYDWLKNTLETSTADFKFVFIHNLVGGNGSEQRGGAEATNNFEWGGENLDGIDEFDKMRESWYKPIHDLLVENNVNAVFHGHDHFYASQEKDGIIYQLVPQPSISRTTVSNATKFGYKNGEILPSSGYLFVEVNDKQATVKYIKTEVGKTDVVAHEYKMLVN